MKFILKWVVYTAIAGVVGKYIYNKSKEMSKNDGTYDDNTKNEQEEPLHQEK